MKTVSLRNEVLKMVCGQSLAYTLPITPYVALFTTAPAADGTGGVEVSGTSYARVSAASKFSAPSSGAVANSAIIDFGTAGGAWGTIVAWAIMTASSSGTMVRKDALTPNVAVASGAPVSFGVGSLQMSEIS